MAMRNEPILDVPIPGMGMTETLGSRPWENPPQYSTVDEAIDYYLTRMASEEFSTQLLDVLEMGVPVTTLANTIQLSSVMEGVHSVDVGILVMPVLMEMMMLIADSAKIKYSSGLDNPNKLKTRDSLLAKLKEGLKKKTSEDNKKTEDSVLEEPSPDEPKGLMARRV